MNRILASAATAALMTIVTPAVAQDTIPALSDRAVVIVSGSGPGSGVDTMARTYIDIAADYTDQSFVVENRTGGAGLIATTYVLNRPADGTTVLGFTRSYALNHLAQPDVEDPLDDYHYIGVTMFAPMAVYTNLDSPYETIEDLIKEARDNPGTQRWAGPYVGSIDWFTSHVLWDALDIDAIFIPHDDGASLAAAVMGGHLDIGTGDMGDVLSRGERLRALALTAADRDPRLPDVPTFQELGYDTVERQFRGFVTPIGLSDEAIEFHDRLYNMVVADPRWEEFLDQQVAQPGDGVKGEEMKALSARTAEIAVPYMKAAGLMQ